MDWEVIDSGENCASENMAIDRDLLLSLKEKAHPVLHLYDWRRDAASYGHFIKPEEHLNLKGAEKRGLDLARRPTGGGIVFHITDLAFSVLIPVGHEGYHENTLSNYHWVNGRLQEVLAPYLSSDLLPQAPEGQGAAFHFCMAKPTVYDLMVGGQKVGGAAQRKMRFGYLHQGTISLGKLPDDYLEAVLLPNTGVLEAMKALTFSLLPEGWTQTDLRKMRAQLKRALTERFTERVTC